MTDKMPADLRRQLRNFCARFLNAAFTEQNLPGFNRLSHFVGGMRLRDRDQLNFICRSARFLRRARDLLAHTTEIFRDRTHYRRVVSNAYLRTSVPGTSTAAPNAARRAD